MCANELITLMVRYDIMGYLKKVAFEIRRNKRTTSMKGVRMKHFGLSFHSCKGFAGQEEEDPKSSQVPLLRQETERT
jgi:hypothetical protein